MNRRSVATSGAVLFGLLAVGCGGGNPNARPMSPVAVTVLYKGVPVEGAIVTFINTDEATPVPAVGRTDAEGVAQMKTYEEGDGAVVGSHKVMIIKNEAAKEEPPAADVESEEYVPPSGSAPPSAVKSLIPRKYSSPGTSGLTVQVTDADEPLAVTFELED